ncbi:MAG: hypothetical protein QXS00_06305 [Pyrobaculum sp.]|uniref:hypothetical protein n=1 Tax=Pyrobaculum sp. TaxID=2004705 RepID=UPI0031794F96
MNITRRSVLRVRGSYVVYLPKRCVDSYAPREVEMFWEDGFIGIKPSARSIVEAGPAAVYIISAFAAGADEAYVKAPLEEVQKALKVVYAEVAEAEGGYVVRFVDKYTEKEPVVELMYHSLVYALSLASRGAATIKTLQAIEDEVDRMRLVVNRLCAKYPTPTCPFYVQLARYYERALDHVIELYSEKPAPQLWRLLLNTTKELGAAVEAGDPEALVQFLSTAGGRRFQVTQLTKGELQTLHADRVIDYLANAAEVYLDLKIYKAVKKSPSGGQDEGTRRSARAEDSENDAALGAAIT